MMQFMNGRNYNESHFCKAYPYHTKLFLMWGNGLTLPLLECLLVLRVLFPLLPPALSLLFVIFFQTPPPPSLKFILFFLYLHFHVPDSKMKLRNEENNFFVKILNLSYGSTWGILEQCATDFRKKFIRKDIYFLYVK